MKKTALTFGLLSLVAVATSFANPSTQNISNENMSIVPPGTGGGMTGGTKKSDFHATESALDIKSNQSFDNTNQSLGANKKLD